MKSNKTQPKPTPKSGGKKPVVVKTLERRTREIALPKSEIKTKKVKDMEDAYIKTGKTYVSKALKGDSKSWDKAMDAGTQAAMLNPKVGRELLRNKMDKKPYKRALPKKK
jgi:hypothetical protein